MTPAPNPEPADDSSNPRLDRRTLFKAGLAGASLAGALLAGQGQAQGPTPPGAADNPITRENRLPGTTDWQLTYPRIERTSVYRCPWIEGYGSQPSVRPGESLDLFVSTNPAGRFRVDVYRLGYYGGQGGRHLLSLGPLEGRTQPDPPVGANRLRECRWEPSLRIDVPREWISGVYLAKLSLVDDRWQSYVIFLVREDRSSELLFQCSDNTWQAYNRWPDNYSLYTNDGGPKVLIPGVDVSFDRPYAKYNQVVDAPYSQGSGEFLLFEYPLAFWLEQQGYDVTYCANRDVHRDRECAQRGKVFLSVGHDEYWSLAQFEHLQEAVRAGTNVAFFSGNTCCFVAPYRASSDGRADRIITRAGRYGGVAPVEESYMGPFPQTGPNEATLIGARTISPFNGSGDWIVRDASHWLFAGTGMNNGDRIPGLVGWEFHGEPAAIPGLEIVAEGDTINGGGRVAHWTATLYPGPRNNWVFNASTIYWSQGLSSPPGHVLPYAHFGRPHGPDARVQKITQNYFARCGVPARASG